jgi:hypothetical protein
VNPSSRSSFFGLFLRTNEMFKQLILLMALVALIGFSAQGAVYYVDPVSGSINFPGTISQPFKTLRQAYNAANPMDVILLLPGLYNTASGEVWPLVIQKDLVIQGTNALNTVLEGSGQNPNILEFLPPTPSSHLANFVLEGVTIRDGHAAIYCPDGTATQWQGKTSWITIANCFIVQNTYGVEMYARHFTPSNHPNDWNNNGYVDQRPRLVNNTIANNEIGIYDHSNGLYGEAEPAIINCLIYPNAGWDVAGVDNWDLNNNAFDSTKVGPNWPPLRPRPVPTIDMVGWIANNFLYMRQLNPNGPFPQDVDYRQYPGDPINNLPRAPTVDQGIVAFTVPNTTTVRQFTNASGLLANIWDVDCEGFGNLRVADVAMDIGADEQGMLIICGYNPKTTDFRSWMTMDTYVVHQPPFAGGQITSVIFDATDVLAGSWNYPHGYLDWSSNPGIVPPVPATMPGTRAEGTIYPPTVSPYGPKLNPYFLDWNNLTAGYPLQLSFAYPIRVPLGQIFFLRHINVQA